MGFTVKIFCCFKRLAGISPVLAVFAGIFLSGCVTQYKIVVEFSPELQERFTEYPTIEVDIAAITESEAGEVKQAGIEKYFAPGSSIRSRCQTQTCFFFRENQATFVLPSRAPIWYKWQLKEPTHILVIASLPYTSGTNPDADPRLLVVKMKKSYILARSLYVLVEPQKIIQVSSLKSSKSKSKSKNKTQEVEQWVEPRRRSR
ncbi:MAG: hypothetical protein LBD07_01030 [Spirochaetaceae bacterium]|jgi:hypothetical protein|nr:hypothetical protein [Spirochaetaceae bacterium]